MTMDETEDANEAPQELIPGLPDALVLDLVLPRLPWYSRPSLLCVSKGWRSALDTSSFTPSQSHLQASHPCPDGLLILHELAMRPLELALWLPKANLNSTDADLEADSNSATFLRTYAISLYDPQGSGGKGKWHRLPPIPEVASGVPHRCSFIANNGTVYVMGGIPDSRQPNKESSAVHALSLCQGIFCHWERRCSMHFGRAFSRCARWGRLIYVAGGTCPAEVYDIGEDSWRRLPEMVDLQFFCNGIFALQNRIVAFGYDIEFAAVERDAATTNDAARVYDLTADRWAAVEFLFTRCCTASVAGHLVYDLVDGVLVAYDTTTGSSRAFDGVVEGEREGEEGFGLQGWVVLDLVVAMEGGSLQHPVVVYALASTPTPSLPHQRSLCLWNGSVSGDDGCVNWKVVPCTFPLLYDDVDESENLSRLCYLSSSP